jgi:predicted CXXCH cytochrome family protein
MRIAVLWCLLCLVLTSCTLTGVRGGTADTVDPHISCSSCHGTDRPKADEAGFAAGIDPSKFCLDCHNYRVNHHPVNFAPAHPVNAAFPLYRGKITCLTCHEIHGTPEKKGERRMLRGGPYPERRTICFTCHTHEQYDGINPHQMLEENGRHRTVNGRPVCLLCHELEPDPSIDQANTVLFRADVGFLCWRCHPPMHSADLRKHFLAVPSEKMSLYLKTGGKYALPLVPRSRITCSTCHNPHQEGVIFPGPAAAGADSPHRLRDQNICMGCHNV